MSRFGYDVMSAGEFLNLLARLQPASTDEPEPPRQRGDRRDRRRPAGPALLSREDLRVLISSIGYDRVRRSAKAFAQPASLPEIRRVLSEIGARHGVTIHPIVPGHPLVDMIANYSPSRLALEMMKVAPTDQMPLFELIIRRAKSAIEYVLSLTGITSERMA